MTKQVNYTAENVVQMTALYQAADSESTREIAIEQIAEGLGKTVASVRSKLSHEGIYIPKVKAEKTGTTRVTKSDLVQVIADFAGLENDSFFDSLEGANKAVLAYVIGLQQDVLALESVEDEIDSPE